jgi:hypothetical protein
MPNPTRRPVDDFRGRPSRAIALAKKTPTSPPNKPLPASMIVEHPRCRSECRDGPRPCPLVGCLFNTYLEVRRYGNVERVKILRPGLLPENVPANESCSLDIADSGPQTLGRVAKLFGLSRERIRQIETTVLKKVLRSIEENDLSQDRPIDKKHS